MKKFAVASLLYAAVHGANAQRTTTTTTTAVLDTASVAEKTVKATSPLLLEDDEYLDDEYLDTDVPGTLPGGLLDDGGIVIRTGEMEEGCVDKNSRFEGQVLTDFIPLLKSTRACQNACQMHPECSYFSFFAGKAGDLDNIQEDDEIELYVPELEDPDADADARRLQSTLPTAQDVLAEPQAGACFFFGPYVKPVDALNFESAPRACPTECSNLYSENCRTTKCCVRSTAQCVSKDSFFGQCRLPTDACPGRSWECRNITYYADGCLEYDIDYAPTSFGNDVEEILDVPTELSCQQLCKRHPRCNYWSYNPWYKQMCLLKKRAVPKRRSKGIISGRKSCIGMDQPTLFDYLMLNEQSYKTTIKFIKAAKLEAELSKPLEKTRSIFVPTELAWKKLDDTVKDSMLKNSTLARDVITTHITPSVVYPERIIGARSFAALKASNGQTIALSRRASDGDILRINKAEILTSDYPLKGYLLSTIDDVLLPNYIIFMIENEEVFAPGSEAGTSDVEKEKDEVEATTTVTNDADELRKRKAAIQAAARAKAVAAARAKVAAAREGMLKDNSIEDEDIPSEAPTESSTTEQPVVTDAPSTTTTTTEEVATTTSTTPVVERTTTEKPVVEETKTTEPVVETDEPDATIQVMSLPDQPIMQMRIVDKELDQMTPEEKEALEVEVKTTIASTLNVNEGRVNLIGFEQGSVITKFVIKDMLPDEKLASKWQQALEDESSPIRQAFALDTDFKPFALIEPAESSSRVTRVEEEPVDPAESSRVTRVEEPVDQASAAETSRAIAPKIEGDHHHHHEGDGHHHHERDDGDERRASKGGFQGWMAGLLVGCLLLCVAVVAFLVNRIRKNRMEADDSKEVEQQEKDTPSTTQIDYSA